MDHLIGLEDLPNELLSDVFTYIDARTLYHCFYNLSYRFNGLLESLTRLCLVLWKSNNDYYDDLFASRIHTLVVHTDVVFTLSRYINVRHLILFNSKDNQISQIKIHGYHLQTISLISPQCFYTTFGLHEMIFSNKLPHLKSCYLTTVYLPSIELRQVSWSQSPSLRSLRISSRDSLIHVAVLNACPNLVFLDLFLFQLDDTTLDVKPHRNLRRMKFILDKFFWPQDDRIFETFFFAMPCLKRLNIQRSAALPERLNDLLQFDWLARIIIRQLPVLKQFIFSLHLFRSYEFDRSKLDKYICQMQTNFVHSFQNYKHYCLQISKF